VFIALPVVGDNYVVAAGILAAIYLLPSLGLNIIFGYTGLLSFAQGAFFGIGAYVSAILATRLGWPFWLTFPAAGLVCAGLAVILAVPSLRLSRFSFVMVTLGFVIIAQTIAQNWVGLTEGNMGLTGVPRPVLALGSRALVLRTVPQYYYFSLAWAAVAICASWWILMSPAGRALRSIRDDEVLAASYGIPVARYKTIAFALSAAFAGVGGALEAHYLMIASPSGFDLYYTNVFLIIVLAGGRGTFWAVPIATVVFVFLAQLASFTPEQQQLLIGLLLLVLVFRLPDGFGPLFIAMAARWQRRAEPRRAPSP
jgi:branched-chain amino acid transport system permease protein